LLTILPELPDQSVVRQILADEIGHYCHVILARRPVSDWAAIQAQTASARLVLDSLRRLESEMDEAWSPQEERLKSACLEAWTRQVGHLAGQGHFEEALTLLQMDEWVWFGEWHRAHGRRRVHLAQTEALCVEADRAVAEGRVADARAHLTAARQSALQVGDPSLVERCDIRLARLAPHDRDPDRGELWELLAARQFEPLLARAEQLQSERPGDPAVAAVRAASIQRLLEAAEMALLNGQYPEARAMAALALKYAPESSRARAVEQATDDRAVGRLVAEVENAIHARRFDDADRLLNEGFGLSPDNQRLLDLSRKLLVARHQAGAGRSEEYDAALREFLYARSERRVEDALESYLRMRALAADAAETAQAWTWIGREYVDHIRRQLEADSSPGTAERLLTSLGRLTCLDRGLPAASELEEQLTRAVRGSEQDRQHRSAELLGRAEKAYNERDPQAALSLIRELEELDDPKYRAATESCRNSVLLQLQRRIDALLGENTGDSLATAETLLDVLQQWDETAAAPRVARRTEQANRKLRSEVVINPVENRDPGKLRQRIRSWWIGRRGGGGVE
jgi:hypothetical protein